MTTCIYRKMNKLHLFSSNIFQFLEQQKRSRQHQRTTSKWKPSYEQNIHAVMAQHAPATTDSNNLSWPRQTPPTRAAIKLNLPKVIPSSLWQLFNRFSCELLLFLELRLFSLSVLFNCRTGFYLYICHSLLRRFWRYFLE